MQMIIIKDRFQTQSIMWLMAIVTRGVEDVPDIQEGFELMDVDKDVATAMCVNSLGILQLRVQINTVRDVANGAII